MDARRLPTGAERARQALLYRSQQQESFEEQSRYRGSPDVTEYVNPYSYIPRARGYEAVRDVYPDLDGATNQYPPYRNHPMERLEDQPPHNTGYIDSRQQRGYSQNAALGKSSQVIQTKEIRQTAPASDHASTRSFLREWWKELLAIIVSVALLAAVYGVLISIHNTRLDNWSMPFNMQPTTLIATLVTLCRLFLVAVVAEGLSQLKWVYFQEKPRRLEDIEHFDSASRSAFGAVLFLGKVRWRALAASIGAVITILALAMEPFAQQSISFHSRAIAQGSLNGKIPRTIAYDLGTPSQVSPYTGEMNSLGRRFYAPVLGSILEGLYSPSNSVKPSCPTSNCTWAPFETLGVCATCEEVAFEETCHHNDTATKACRYSSADTPDLDGACETFAGGYTMTLWHSKAYGSYLGPAIVNVSALYFSWPAKELGGYNCGPGFKFPAHVTQCRLKWCVKTIRSKMTNGVLTEMLMSSTDLVFPPQQCHSDGGTQPPTFWITGGSNDLDWQLGAFKSQEEIPENLCSKDWIRNNNTAFWINYQDYKNMQNLLYSIFEQYLDTATYDEPMAELIYSVNDRNLTTDFMGIADSMTNHIRMGPNTTDFIGTVSSTETYIEVNWLWLIYPLTLVLSGLAFLASAILFSARNNGLVWKSSTLAMLFHGLSAYNGPAPLWTSHMKEDSKRIWAKLDEDEQGRLKLVQDRNPVR